jgi:Bacterial Ig-like domain
MRRDSNGSRLFQRSTTPLVIEVLEGRLLPSGIGFTSALGVGATGSFAAIRSNAVATDSAGDTFVTGSFRATAAFNPNSPSATITTDNTQDTFVAKYGPTGSLLWVSTFAGQPTTNPGGFTSFAVSQGSAIAVDSSRDVFVAGSFSGTMNVTGLSGVTQETSATSATEPYVAKLDPSGNVTWFDAIGGTAFDTDSANTLALDGSGGVVIAGSFEDSATFGATTLTTGGSSDAFVARVNGSGAFSWAVATQGGSGSNASVQGVAVDGSGNVDLGGFFSGSVDFDPSSSSTVLTSAGSDDAMLWRLDSTGKLLWARSYGSADFDATTAVSVDASGALYATGAFSDMVNFGTVAKPALITAGPVFDTFLLKVDPNGNELWVDGLVGATGSSKGQGVAVDPFGTVHVAGTFSGPLAFSTTDTLTSVGSSDAFVAGYDASGNLTYALQAGQTNFNAALGVAVNATGLVTVTGTYSGSISFGSTTLPSLGAGSFFVAQAVTQFPAPAPSAPVLEASSDSGISQSDDITNVTSPVLDVNTAGASNTVELFRNGVEVAQRTGPGPLQDPGPLAQGTYTYTAIQISPVGLTGPASPSCSVTVLTVPPATLPTPILDPTDDSGTLGDRITNVNQPRLEVAASGGLTVQLLNSSGTVIGSVFQASTGTCVVKLAQALPDGVYPIRARAVDVAGNIGQASSSFTLTIDTTPPLAPSIPILLPAADSGTLGDNLTNVRQPHLTGTAEQGSTVQIVDSNGNVDGSAVAGSNGAFTIKMNTSLADGSYVLSARATDAVGNQGPLGPSLTLTILATPPPKPTTPLIIAADVSGPSGSNLTNVRQPRITGTAKASTTVDLFSSTGSLLASAVAGSNGSYTAKVSNPLADGSWTLDAVAIDVAGNVSPASATLTFTIDTTPPLAPSILTLLPADDTGTIGDNLTNVRQPRLTGTAEQGSTVQIVDGNGNVDGSAVASSNGAFTIKVNTSLADGTYVFAARATDAAGNQGPLGPAVSLTILTVPPAAPSSPTLLAQDDSGTVGDRITKVRQPRLTGTATHGLTIRLINSSNAVLGTATASSNGSVTVSPSSPLADGAYVLELEAVDAAGNVSLPGGTIILTILATPPPKPPAPMLLASADTGVLGDGVTSVRRPTIVGTAAPGDRIDWVTASGSVLVSTTAAASTGSYQLEPPTALVNGTYPVTVRATDIAGNVSPSSSVFSLTIRAAAGDYFGNNESDISVFRPADAFFFIEQPSNGALFIENFGGAGDVPINGDFLGNGHSDIAVYRPSTSTFYYYDPISGGFGSFQLGTAGDVPVPADYDGDGRTDFAVFNPTTATYLVQMSATNTTFTRAFGGPGDIPVPADYFGNGHADLAVYRPSNSTFYVYDPIGGGTKVVTIGSAGSTPVPADYEGLGHVDPAVYEPSSSTYVIQMSATNTTYTRAFGAPGDVPVPADYLGNGRADLAVYRPSDVMFFALDIPTSASKVMAWGAANETFPTLSPITSWFSFGGGAVSSAFSAARPLSSEVLDYVPIPLTTDLVAFPAFTTGQKAKAVDRAIDSLSLESWRPGN